MLVKDASNEESGQSREGEQVPGLIYELYDLINDNFETSDIAAQTPDIIDYMSNILIGWMVSCTRSGICCQASEIRRLMEYLGFA